MFFSTCSAGALSGPDFCFIFAPCGYDEPESLPSGSPTIGLTGADGGQREGGEELGRHQAGPAGVWGDGGRRLAKMRRRGPPPRRSGLPPARSDSGSNIAGEHKLAPWTAEGS